MYALHPKTHKCITKGFFLSHTSFGVFWLKYLWGFQALMFITMLIISTQNFELNLGCWCIMQQATLMMVQLILWTKPFCCDVYGIKFLMHNPLSFDKISKLPQTMFPVVVNSKHFYLLPNLCFKKAFEFLKLWKTFLTSWKAHKNV
jgi:hypothetical protein